MIAGYGDAQIANAAIIADVARAQGLGDRGALFGVMCAMGESSLRNINYGDWETSGVRNPDGTPTTSIGLFQQQASWGSVADRMDPIYAAWAFFRALVRVGGWSTLAPTIAIHRTQINADPNHYAKYEGAARAVLAAIPGLRAKGAVMPDPMELIECPWQPGMFGRRALIEALDRAGRPRINSMHRTYGDQKEAWDNSPAMGGKGSPADDPDRPQSFELGHVRGVAADIDVTPENVRRLAAQGLVRPFSWEGWHWRLPGSVQKWPLIFSLPTAAGGGAKPIIPKEWDEMATREEVRAEAKAGFIEALNDVAVTNKLAEVVENELNERMYGDLSLIPIAELGNAMFLRSASTRRRIQVQSTDHAGFIRRALENRGMQGQQMSSAEVDIVDAYCLAVYPPDALNVDVVALSAALNAISKDQSTETIRAAVTDAINAHTSTIAFVQKPTP